MERIMVSANVFDSIMACSTRSQIRCDVRAAEGCLDIIGMRVGWRVCVCVNLEQIFAHFPRDVVVTRFVRINFASRGVHLLLEMGWILLHHWQPMRSNEVRLFVDFIPFCVDMNNNNKIAGERHWRGVAC